MEKIEKIQKVLEAALFEEDALVESYADQKKSRIAAEHFHRARGILYAIQLIADPYYLEKQAEILEIYRIVDEQADGSVKY